MTKFLSRSASLTPYTRRNLRIDTCYIGVPQQEGDRAGSSSGCTDGHTHDDEQRGK
jgi:hypothetical protein